MVSFMRIFGSTSFLLILAATHASVVASSPGPVTMTSTTSKSLATAKASLAKSCKPDFGWVRFGMVYDRCVFTCPFQVMCLRTWLVLIKIPLSPPLLLPIIRLSQAQVCRHHYLYLPQKVQMLKTVSDEL